MYLLKVNIAFILFYAFYKLILSRDTFFTWRRVTLLTSIFISIIIPLINISGWLQEQHALNTVSTFYNEIILPDFTITPAGSTYSQYLNTMSNFLIAIYLSVALVLLIRFLIQLSSIMRLAYKSRVQNIGRISIRLLKNNLTPFSFFHLIFISPDSHNEKELSEIITHECVHAEQWHSLDAVLGELACIAFWYNPFIWLIKQEIRNNLEYLADNSVLRKGYDTKSYQYHLLGLTYQKAAANLVNNFNVLLLKKRIKMMNKERTKEIGKAKYFLLLPMAAMLLMGSNMNVQAEVTSKAEITSDMTTVSDKDEIVKAAERMPQFPGGNAAMMDFVNKNIKYPQKAYQEKVQGSVVARFAVKKDGSIGDVVIIKKAHPLLDKEAIRVIKTMPKFEPGTIDNKPVDVWFSIPITFSVR